MTWQAHVSGHAPSPPPTGRVESEETKVKLVWLGYSFEQVKLKAILYSLLFLLFSTFWLLLKIKEHHQNLFILCVIILRQA
jgi:hypothetical protein